MSKYKLPKVEELLDAGVHFGHQTKRWHPRMEPYIFTAKKNIHIIDLVKTDELLKEASEFLYETAKKGEQIIFVGTKKQARETVESEAKRAGLLYVTERWIGGTITNFKVIKKNIDKLVSFMKRREEGDLEKYTKRERLLIDREIEKLQRNIGGIVAMRGVPGAIVTVDAKREVTAIREAKRAGVTVVGLVDTNSDPSGLDYVIPGNDDAIKSIALVLKTLGDAVEEGYKEYARSLEEGKETPKKTTQTGELKEAPAVVSADESPVVTEAAETQVEKQVEKEVAENESVEKAAKYKDVLPKKTKKILRRKNDKY